MRVRANRSVAKCVEAETVAQACLKLLADRGIECFFGVHEYNLATGKPQVAMTCETVGTANVLAAINVNCKLEPYVSCD